MSESTTREFAPLMGWVVFVCFLQCRGSVLNNGKVMYSSPRGYLRIGRLTHDVRRIHPSSLVPEPLDLNQRRPLLPRSKAHPNGHGPTSVVARLICEPTPCRIIPPSRLYGSPLRGTSLSSPGAVYRVEVNCPDFDAAESDNLESCVPDAG